MKPTLPTLPNASSSMSTQTRTSRTCYSYPTLDVPATRFQIRHDSGLEFSLRSRSLVGLWASGLRPCVCTMFMAVSVSDFGLCGKTAEVLDAARRHFGLDDLGVDVRRCDALWPCMRRCFWRTEASVPKVLNPKSHPGLKPPTSTHLGG